MPENNQMMSVKGQLVGMPLAGPESFSQQQLDYLKRALGVDETVLWEDSNGKTPSVTGDFPITLSETISNFERVRFYWQTFNNSYMNHTVSEKMTDDTSFTLEGYIFNSSSDSAFSIGWTLTSSGTTLSHGMCKYNNWANNTVQGGGAFVRLYKVVGIHRIAGGN